MPPRTRAEAEELLEKLARRDAELRSEGGEPAWDQVERFIKYAWAFGTVVVGITLWTAKVQWELAGLSKEVAANTSRCERLADQRVADQMLMQTAQSTIVTNRNERIADIKLLADSDNRQQRLWELWLPRIEEMNAMKDFGVSNKERFFQKNRYAAPALPGLPTDPDR